MKKMLIVLVAAFTLALTQSACMAQKRERVRQEFEKRFEAADVNHDGKLTLEEARAGMPKVASNFEKIDVEKKGYVTREDIARAIKNRK